MAGQQDYADARGRPGRHRQKPPRRKAVVRTILVTLVVLALGTGITVAWAYRNLNSNVRHHDYTGQLTNRPDAVVVDGPRNPVNILVMGSDSREGDNNIDGVTDMGTHSDTTILFHLSADRTRAYGISIPRDSIVERPDCVLEDGSTVAGYPEAQWNEAFNKAGPACTQQQFEQLTGVRVDHTVVVDFSGFKAMVDAIGGVEVCVPEPIIDHAANIHLPAGTYEVMGDQSLDYVRERKGVGDGSDIGRMKRQQAFIASMANKVVSAGTLANPVKLYKFLDAATKSLDVDSGLKDLKTMASLGYQFKDIGLSEIRFVTIPWEAYPADPNRVQWKPEEAARLWELVRNDQPLPRNLSSISADKPSGNGGGGNQSPDTPGPGPDTSEDAAAVGLCG